ncbi:F-box family protein, partial [Trifolium medium]|nr:F-box family protein [Trifolium medium]
MFGEILKVSGFFLFIWFILSATLILMKFVIVSLDLGTETYNQYKFPRGFDEVPPGIPT